MAIFFACLKKEKERKHCHCRYVTLHTYAHTVTVDTVIVFWLMLAYVYTWHDDIQTEHLEVFATLTSEQ